MRRKIMLHGPSSLTISLPAKWVKEKNLKKGDEIDLIEEDKGLLVSPVLRNREIKKINLKLAGMDSETQRDVLLALHKKGYDEIKLSYEDPRTAKDIHSMLNELNLGFEIIRQGSNSLVIGNVSNPESEQFDNLFRRVFRIVVEYKRKIQAVVERKEEITESCFSHRTSINRITKLCRRIIIKENKALSSFIFSFLDDFERIAYALSLLEEELKENRQPPSVKFAKAFEDAAGLLTGTYDLYYDFDFRRYSDWRKLSRSLKSEIRGCKGKHDSGSCFWEHLECIHLSIDNLLVSTLAVKL